MPRLVTVCRVLLGAVFVLFSVSYYFPFIPIPPPPDAARAFTSELEASGYFYPLLKATELLCGLALLGGVFVPLALTMLAPIVLQIGLFHLFLAPAALSFAIAMGALELFLAWTYRDAFAPLLSYSPASRTQATGVEP